MVIGKRAAVRAPRVICGTGYSGSEQRQHPL